MKRSVWMLVAALLMACGGGGGKKSGAEGAAEQFLDLYFVRIDQLAARDVTVGPARETIEQELAETASLRADGYGPDQAGRARILYEKAWTGPVVDGSARLIYDLRIDHPGSSEDPQHRHVLLTVREDKGTWKVATFTLKEGKARAPGAAPSP